MGICNRIWSTKVPVWGCAIEFEVQILRTSLTVIVVIYILSRTSKYVISIKIYRKTMWILLKLFDQFNSISNIMIIISFTLYYSIEFCMEGEISDM